MVAGILDRRLSQNIAFAVIAETQVMSDNARQARRNRAGAGRRGRSASSGAAHARTEGPGEARPAEPRVDAVPGATVRIKKYPNRRFYDAAHRRHVTLGDLHEMILAGGEIQVTDSATGEDITNVVLTQIILEQDPPKLDLFPATVLHQLIRTQRQFMGSVADEFFRQWLTANRQSQQRWAEMMQQVWGAAPVAMNPFHWAQQVMGAMQPPGVAAPASPPFHEPPAAPPRSDAPTQSPPTPEIDALRDEMARIMRRFEQISGSR